jgi:hypothetical protein
MILNAILFNVVFWVIMFFLLYLPVRRIIRIRQTPITPIAKLPKAGTVKIRGRTFVNEEVKNSPISNKKCVYWDVEIRYYRSGTKTIGSWESVSFDQSSQPISVHDKTGAAKLMTGEWASLNITRKDNVTKSKGRWDELDTKIKSILPQGNTKWLNSLGRLHVTERLIQPQEDLFIYGHVERQDDLAVVKPSEGHPLEITDGDEQKLLTHLYSNIRGKVFAGLLIFLSGMWLILNTK